MGKGIIFSYCIVISLAKGIRDVKLIKIDIL